MHIKISVTTGAKRESVKARKAGGYAIAVSALPERGQANARALELLREHLGPSVRVLRIVSGHHASHKVVEAE